MRALLRSLAKAVGLHFVKENHVAPVIRLGMYRGVRGPGFVWITPIIESLGDLIDVGIRFTQFDFEQVLTKDSIPLDFKITILYSFDPALPTHKVAAQLVRQPRSVLTSIVRDYADHWLRGIVAAFSVEEICGGRPLGRIKNRLQRILETELPPLGLVPMPGSGVLIRTITPPADFTQTVLEAKRHEATLRALALHPESKIDRAIAAEWVNSMPEQGNVLPFVPFVDVWGASRIYGGDRHGPEHAISSEEKRERLIDGDGAQKRSVGDGRVSMVRS